MTPTSSGARVGADGKVDTTAIADPRTRAMYENYLEGMTMQEAGADFGIGRERVRQIFGAAGLPSRSPARSRSLRRALRRQEKAGQICAVFVKARDPEVVAHRLDLPLAMVREVLKEQMPVAYRHRPRPRRRTYSEEELLALLREAANGSEVPLSTAAYRACARGRKIADGRPWPAPQTYYKRLGEWRVALQKAGLPPTPPASRKGCIKFDDAACLRALRAVAGKLGEAPSGAEYRRFAMASGGAFPSFSTVRSRFGSWAEALQQAGLWDDALACSAPVGVVQRPRGAELETTVMTDLHKRWSPNGRASEGSRPKKA
jgi:Homing endonuclease associated repeat/Sigma-70, region 4